MPAPGPEWANPTLAHEIFPTFSALNQSYLSSDSTELQPQLDSPTTFLNGYLHTTRRSPLDLSIQSIEALSSSFHTNKYKQWVSSQEEVVVEAAEVTAVVAEVASVGAIAVAEVALVAVEVVAEALAIVVSFLLLSDATRWFGVAKH